jgi:hypothetical protein
MQQRVHGGPPCAQDNIAIDASFTAVELRKVPYDDSPGRIIADDNDLDRGTANGKEGPAKQQPGAKTGAPLNLLYFKIVHLKYTRETPQLQTTNAHIRATVNKRNYDILLPVHQNSFGSMITKSALILLEVAESLLRTQPNSIGSCICCNLK